MSYSHTARGMCAPVDTSQYERIDNNQFRRWLSNGEIVASSSCETSTDGLNRNEHMGSRCGRYQYHGTTISSQLTIDTSIDTYSEEETKRRLDEFGGTIYLDGRPDIIQSRRSDIPIRYEQRVTIQYLQPPTLPPPGPIIIEEVRPPQPPAPAPVVIRQHDSRVSTPPPLILREQPPKAPLHGCSEKYIRQLPSTPVPPRSVRIEIFPRAPEKPRDIKIERWLPYPPQPEREIFVKRAPPAIEYPKPTHTIVHHNDVDKHVERKFERLDVIREDPYDYKARFGTSLLDSATLVQEAARAGVHEDTSSSTVTPLINTNTYEDSARFQHSYERITHDYSSSSETNYRRTPVLGVTRTTNVDETNRLSSSPYVGYSSTVDSGCGAQSEVHVGYASASTINTKYDEQSDEE